MLEKIVLSPLAVMAWQERCKKLSWQLKEVEAIPDEEAEELPGGSLRIFVPGVRGAELIIPKEQWAWEQ